MNRIYRSETDKFIAGICGGFAEIYQFDPTIVRLLTVLLTFITGLFPLVVVYIIGWVVIPKKSDIL